TAMVKDSADLFMPTVSTVGAGNSYSLSLSSPRTPPGHYTGSVTVSLCSDSACANSQQVPSVAIPYDVYVLATSSAWPGNNLTTLAPWPDVPDWSMFQGNAAHTGYVPTELDPNSFSTRWQTPALDIPVAWDSNLNTLTTSNGQLFIGGR